MLDVQSDSLTVPVLSLRNPQDVAVLGVDVLANGGFSSDLISWTGSNWNWNSGNSGQAKHSIGSVAALSQNLSVADGETYQIDMTLMKETAGSVTVSVGSEYIYEYASAGINFSETGTYTKTIAVSGSGSQVLRITPSSDFDGAISAISVKLVTAKALSYSSFIDNAGATALEMRATDALNNTFVGKNAGEMITTGALNSFFGHGSGASNTNGFSGSFVGYDAGNHNTTGVRNSFFGAVSGYSNTVGDGNSFFGYAAGWANTSGYQNSFFGLDCGNKNTTGHDNSFFGNITGYSNTTGSSNAFFGNEAGRYNTTGGNNSFFGLQSGNNNESGDRNSFIGGSAGYSNTSGSDNAFFGFGSGYLNSEGIGNSFFGRSAGQSNTVGNSNSFVGYLSGYLNSTGNQNSFLGAFAGFNSQTGAGNVFVGFEAARGGPTESAYTGSDSNTIVGFQSGYSLGDNQDGNIFLGYQSGYGEVGSNKLYIEDSNADKDNALIYGEFDNDIIALNGVTKLKKHTSATVPTCVANLEGGTIYNSTDKYMCFCDGTDWKQFQSPVTNCF